MKFPIGKFARGAGESQNLNLGMSAQAGEKIESLHMKFGYIG
jgi:hypothetical protein